VTRADRPSHHVVGLPPPVSELPWSADFVMQALEILPVMLVDGALTALRPDCAPSFIVGWPAGARPEAVVADAAAMLGLTPIVLHSTSWRHVGSEVVLTYLVAIEPVGAPPESWCITPVGQADLARGDVTAPPIAIAVDQVLEHAMRHLAWLVADDPAIAAALADWRTPLAAYVPEPFRAFAMARPPGG
jgi:hypothetical protein